jgi:D-glycero-alpha-D-manno-heptose-7-phosphate kinase
MKFDGARSPDSAMIISRTPLRISFFGGGTDYPAWYERTGSGATLSTSIDKYCYITCRYLPPFFDKKNRIVWSKVEFVDTFDEIEHPSVRETLKFLNIRDGVEIHYNGDLPARSGLGSSSSFTVGLLNALNALQGRTVDARTLALDAIHIEQERIKESVGSQDQVAAAFGGLNRIGFGGPEKIKVTPLAVAAETIRALEGRLMLFFTGFARTASEVASEQIKNTPAKEGELRTMLGMVDDAQNILTAPGRDIDDFGRLLHETWQLKRGLTSLITNKHIDDIYEAGRAAGALGGKLLGAGGGGFVLFYVRPEARQAVQDALKHLLRVPFRFEQGGSQIIYRTPGSSSADV